MKQLALSVLLSLAAATAAQAQFTGIKGGANAAVLDAERVGLTAGYRVSYHAGVFYNYNVFGPVSLRPELLYSLQGGEFKDAQQDYRTKLHYLNLPLLVDLKLGPVHLQAGPQFGLLLTAQETGVLLAGYSPTGQPQYTKVSGQVTEQYRKQDFGFCGGLELDLTDNLTLGGRLNAGLSDIQDYKGLRSANDPRLRNRVFQGYVAVRFGGR